MSISHLMIAAALSSILGVACASANDSEPDEREAIASDSEAWRENALTRRQEVVALKTIDNACADTWCEGDHNFAFRRLSCSWFTGSCTLTLEILPHDPIENGCHGDLRVCRTSGFTGYASLVTTAPTGEAWLQESYNSALSECIGRLEADLP